MTDKHTTSKEIAPQPIRPDFSWRAIKDLSETEKHRIIEIMKGSTLSRYDGRRHPFNSDEECAHHLQTLVKSYEAELLQVFKEDANSEEIQFLFALRKGIIIACLLTKPFPPTKLVRVMHVNVSSEIRNSEVGSKLMANLHASIDDRVLFGYILASNPALDFYLKQGWVQSNDVADFPDRKGKDWICLTYNKNPLRHIPLTVPDVTTVSHPIVPAKLPEIIPNYDRYTTLVKDGSWVLSAVMQQIDLNSEVYKKPLKPIINSVGSLVDSQSTLQGTGWIFMHWNDKTMVISNRHVAKAFYTRLNGKYIPNPAPCDRAYINLDGEFGSLRGSGSKSGKKFPLKLLFWCSDVDVAVFVVDGPFPQQDYPELPLSNSYAVNGRVCAVIGYPDHDEREKTPQHIKLKIFGPSLGYKRISFGLMDQGSDNTEIHHDAPTLGGNSGSPVVDVQSGVVSAIHCGGTFNLVNGAWVPLNNDAVPAAILLKLKSSTVAYLQL